LVGGGRAARACVRALSRKAQSWSNSSRRSFSSLAALLTCFRARVYV